MDLFCKEDGILVNMKYMLQKYNGFFSIVKEDGCFSLLMLIAMVAIMLIAAGISSCSAVLNGGLSATMAGSYQSQPAQLDASDEAMTSREMALQNTIDSIEEDYPDYDEYNYYAVFTVE